MSLYPARSVAPLMDEQYARFAIPAVYANAPAAGSSSRSAAAAPAAHTSPFSSSALADHTPYRSMINSSAAAGSDEQPAWHSLQATGLSRAVHLDAQHNYAPEQSWFAQPAAAKSFDAFGAPQKHSQFSNSFLPPAALPAPALKELTLPARLEAVPLTRSVSLPVMPAYLESSCFSLAKAAMKPAEMMAHVQAHLKTAGVVVAERADRKLEVSTDAS